MNSTSIRSSYLTGFSFAACFHIFNTIWEEYQKYSHLYFWLFLDKLDSVLCLFSPWQRYDFVEASMPLIPWPLCSLCPILAFKSAQKSLFG